MISRNDVRRCRPIQPYGDPPGAREVISDTQLLHTPYSTNERFGRGRLTARPLSKTSYYRYVQTAIQ
jgi:hypothetical protein